MSKATKAMRLANLNHGHALAGKPSPTYRTWAMMRNRCLNKRAENYSFYGGRGIGICDKWSTFQGFLEDMGDKPEGMSLDRIDNDGKYSRENCRWATKTEQARNRRSSRFEEINDVKKTVPEWAEEYGINVKSVYTRLYKGMTIEEALKD